ncbi:fibrobacter succinogenes major paralogous domain-containing protein [Flavobacteriales bacterium]|nr:fibrobacter succinogenes major paralogous domain-containing protein [Flavobacteriales bacterium]MDA9019300.1 fibrobacter succinogenes major paralogous domain-containing protein [Flavobacteriales bacterium]
MKNLFALLLCLCTAFSLYSQAPNANWEPDWDGDNNVGVSDLLGLLGVFGDFDADDDGVWDSVDDCVGDYDDCGVCNGPGPQFQVVDTILVTYDSVFVDYLDDWIVFEVSTDTIFDLQCVWECGLNIEFSEYSYSTVEIGNQCWFTENLRTNFYQNGDSITLLESPSDWISAVIGARCFYNNDIDYVPAYGQFYNWHAVDDARGICPTGWHVPTNPDWQELIDLFGGDNLAGTALKANATEFLIWDGTNESGLTALPGGYRDSDWGGTNYEGGGGYYWTGTPYGIDHATSRALWTGGPQAYASQVRRSDGRSVRCVKD